VNSYQITKCRLCSSDSLQEILSLGTTPSGDLYKSHKLESLMLKNYPLICNMCINCGHVQLSHFVDPTEIYSEYIYKTSDSLGLNTHFDSFSQDLKSYLNTNKRMNLLEIGCNDGTLMQ